MRVILAILSASIFGLYLHPHHGPGWRGFNPDKQVAISGTMVKCFDCSNGSRGHGWLQVRVDGVLWQVTLPDTQGLRRAKVSLSKMKAGSAVQVSGFANVSRAHDMYAREIIVNGVRLFSPSSP